MPKPANYFRIGIFILCAIAIFVVGLVVFGAGQFFKRKITFETYEKGTVQGIDVGSPVKFRGVQIGQVSWLGFSFNAYPQTDMSNKENYVIIRMEVDKEIFPGMFQENLEPVLEKGIARGMRVRIEPLGITGLNYLEINYVDDPAQYPLLPFHWRPTFYYIPSAPGELTDILDSMNKIMRDVEQLNLGEIQGGLTQLLQNLNKALTDAQIDQVSQNLQSLLTQLDKAIQEAKLGDLSADARSLMSGLEESNKDLQKVLSNLNPEEIRSTLRSLSATMDNLEDFSSSIKQRPSSLLWGGPPKPEPASTPTPYPRKRTR